MRGKGLGNPFSHRQVGITPAYAGKSSSFFAISSACWDHPRLCGEKRCPLWCPLRFRGSPPPMRGKEMPLGQGVLHFRITPAYAGKRWRKRGSGRAGQDHPRLCGEKITAPTTQKDQLGSPPPMRGKDTAAAPTSSKIRITPAYAGKRSRGRHESPKR